MNDFTPFEFVDKVNNKHPELSKDAGLFDVIGFIFKISNLRDCMIEAYAARISGYNNMTSSLRRGFLNNGLIKSYLSWKYPSIRHNYKFYLPANLFSRFLVDYPNRPCTLGQNRMVLAEDDILPHAIRHPPKYSNF